MLSPSPVGESLGERVCLVGLLVGAGVEGAFVGELVAKEGRGVGDQDGRGKGNVGPIVGPFVVVVGLKVGA